MQVEKKKKKKRSSLSRDGLTPISRRLINGLTRSKEEKRERETGRLPASLSPVPISLSTVSLSEKLVFFSLSTELLLLLRRDIPAAGAAAREYI